MSFSTSKTSLGGSALCFFLCTGTLFGAIESGNEFLDMDMSQLMDITITSVSKKEQKLSDAAAAIFVITQEDIRRSGVTHIADALAMAPGIQVAKISASKWSVSSRGFSGYTSNKLLVLIDGRSVYSPAYSGTLWDMQNTLLEDIEQIEIIRGPGGTLWGANAVNGVINIITKNSAETKGGLVRAGVGSEETLQGAVRYGGELNDSIDGRIYATFNDRDSNKLASSSLDYIRTSEDANDDWQNFQTGYRVDGRVGDDAEWTLQGDVFKNKGDQIIYPYWIATSPYLTEKEGTIDSNGGNLLGRYQRHISNSSSFSVQTYYDNTERDDNYYSYSSNTFDLEVQYETKLGERNNFTTGAGYRYISGNFNDSFQIQVKDRDDQLFSAFLQDEITLIEDTLWFTAGLKWEKNDYTGTEWQPSARLMWKPGENHTLWSSVARAVRTPSSAEHDGAILVASYPTQDGLSTSYILGDKDFESEIVYAYELGYRWQTSADFAIDLATFYNDYEDLYTLAPGAGESGTDFSFINGVEGEGYGVEIAADWQTTSWISFALAYSYLHMEEATDNIRAGFFSDASPNHQVSLRSSVDLSKKWQANIWLRYVDEIIARNSTDVVAGTIALDDYVLLDLNLIWKIDEDLEIMLTGQNLINDSNLQYVSEVITPATEIERGVYLKLTYRF